MTIELNKLLYRLLQCSLVLLFSACSNNEHHEDANTSGTPSIAVPTLISYQLMNEYPHDTAAFTEGLEFDNGYLYESTGEYSTSDLRKTDVKTGKVVLSRKLNNNFFGEGLTILNDKIYQITYREHKGFVYNKTNFKLERTFTIDANEGWGLTNDGKYLIYDDGSNMLHYLDPNSFKEVKTLAVTDEHGPVQNINELEFIKGFIYANIWKADQIIKIDPATGKVVARADLGDLRQKTSIPQPGNSRTSPEVMNGIAYDATSNKIFITGKYWPKVFEIKLDN